MIMHFWYFHDKAGVHLFMHCFIATFSLIYVHLCYLHGPLLLPQTLYTHIDRLTLLSHFRSLQSAPWWLPVERVFWRQVSYFPLLVFFYICISLLLAHLVSPSADALWLSLQGLAPASGSAWTSRWFRWAGTMLRPSAGGEARGCLQRRSGSGLHEEVCKVHI